MRDVIKVGDLVLIIFTSKLEAKLEQIEDSARVLKTAKAGIRVGETIVDNVFYDIEFLTFPADLRLIRNREDMDDAWDSIEQNLEDLFLSQENKKAIQ